MFKFNNPYLLFLILVLLIMGTDPLVSKKIETIKSVIDKITGGINNFMTGINSLEADFEDVNIMLMNLNKPNDTNN